MAKKVISRYGEQIDLKSINIETDPIFGLTSTDVQGTLEEINSKLSGIELEVAASGIDFVKPDGTKNELRYTEIDSNTSNPKMTMALDGTVFYTQPINKNDIHIDSDNSEWDLTDDKLTIVNTDGETVTTLNFSKYNVSLVVLSNTDIEVIQNGVSLGVISQNADGILYDNTVSGLTAVNVKKALDELAARETVVPKIKVNIVATENQTLFPLGQTPNQPVLAFRNGIALTKNEFTYSSTNATYVPANNGDYTMKAGDEVTFIFEYTV